MSALQQITGSAAAGFTLGFYNTQRAPNTWANPIYSRHIKSGGDFNISLYANAFGLVFSDVYDWTLGGGPPSNPVDIPVRWHSIIQASSEVTNLIGTTYQYRISNTNIVRTGGATGSVYVVNFVNPSNGTTTGWRAFSTSIEFAYIAAEEATGRSITLTGNLDIGNASLGVVITKPFTLIAQY